MEFAKDLCRDDHAAASELLSKVTEWNQPPSRLYWTAEATGLDSALLEGCSRAFFIKMQPGTNVYRHRDPESVVKHFDTDHVVVSTNDQSFICWMEDGIEHSQHLEHGKRYRIRDRGLLHWAVNHGDTDRVHLLIQYPKV
jgi:hypothetical protein